jgi:class 3 adenylate cyclase
MPLAREQRKLAAIIAADVVGYSRLMGRDESGTLARLREPLFRDSQIGISRYAPQAINPTPTT